MNGQTHKFFSVRNESCVNGRGCDHPGCASRGEFRAPKSPSTLHDYYWFCLEHVREYNRAWDFFAGRSSDEIEAAIRDDVTWQRQTWPLGHMTGGKGRFSSAHVRDPFNLFAEDEWHPAERAHSPAEEDAMKVMDLKAPLTVETVRSRYKQLCKLHHPDANGGDKASEERFKKIGQAYKTLMESLNPTA